MPEHSIQGLCGIMCSAVSFLPPGGGGGRGRGGGDVYSRNISKLKLHVFHTGCQVQE